MVNETDIETESVSSVDGFKQRIIGAVVLVCAAIIILPMIFDEPHVKSENRIIPIPVAPARPVIQIASPVAPKFQVFEIGAKQKSSNETGTVSQFDSNIEMTDDVLLADEQDSNQSSNDEIPPPPLESDKREKKIAAEKVPNKTVLQAHQEADSPASKAIAKPVREPSKPVAKLLDSPEVADQKVFRNVWMVRLGVFGKETNAYQLRDKVRTLGYTAHTRQLTRDSRILVAVYAGPFVSEKEAKSRKLQLDKALGKEKIVGIVQNIESF
ncbi:MAG: SPOR domain-containing protein [Hahellaceae bacterium]|nr:SPOR domain-containing protein [Hahellaceae bacterium]